MSLPARSLAVPLAAFAGVLIAARMVSAVTRSGYYGVWETAG